MGSVADRLRQLVRDGRLAARYPDVQPLLAVIAASDEPGQKRHQCRHEMDDDSAVRFHERPHLLFFYGRGTTERQRGRAERNQQTPASTYLVPGR